jgi:prolipoprotein diacylglyceryltransferase
MAYGAFRFAHEFLRDDARWAGPVGGYHVIALAMIAVGAWMYGKRKSVPGKGGTNFRTAG